MTTSARPQTLYRYRFGDIELDESRMELVAAGQAVELEPRPLALLLKLLRRAGEVVTREELIESVWAGRPTVDNVIPNAVTKLRKVLGSTHADAIVNIPRVGYRLDAAVERKVVHAPASASPALSAGQAVPGRPAWRLESLLDHGETHEVWLARETPGGTARVFKFGLDGSALPALKREAALARLLQGTLGERPDIVAVLDWNFAVAPFHLEYDYGGQSLPQWAVEDGRLAAMPHGSRLGLFLQIADAVAAAHGVGVLHKDIKPANTLVAFEKDGGWQVRLTDFGSGGMLDPQRLAELGITRPGLLATADLAVDSNSSGTPTYYAPELLAGESPSVRSDIYALGILLYQLLAGALKRPLSPGWERDVGDELLAEDIARATDGDPQRRFASVAEFSRNLRELQVRHERRERRAALERQVREAAQLQARVRARRPWVFATIGTLAIGLGAFAWQYLQAASTRDAAQREAQYAQAINRFLTNDLLKAGNPALWGKRDPSMREVLGRARDGLERRDDLSAGVAADIHATLAQAYQGMSDYATAEAQYLKAIERGTPGDARVLQAELQLARLLAVRSKMPEAEKHLGHALAAAGPLERRRDSVPMYAHWARASLLTLSQKLDDAAIAYNAALDAEARFPAPEPSTRTALMLELADAHSRSGHMGKTIALLTELLGARHARAISASTRANAHVLLGRALVAEKRLDEAEPALRTALDELTGIYGPDHYYVHLVHSEIAPLHWLSGRNDSALEHARLSHDGFVKLFSREHQVPLMAQQVLATAEFFSGNLDAANANYAQAHAGLGKLLGEDAPLAMGTAYHRAFALAENGRLDEAERLLPRMDGKALNEATQETLWPMRIQGLRGLLLSARGRREEALPLLADALRELRTGGEPERYLSTLEKAGAFE